MKLETELATLYWELTANVLRQHNVGEAAIQKCGQHFKAGFVLGYAAGVNRADDEIGEDLEPAVGFAIGGTTSDDDED